jgi:EAL domain-containing protein (putative c-di-GMP-specific phosphodiesterase class I)
MGNEVAIEYLKETAERLKSVLRSSDSVALLAPDELEATVSKLSEGEFGLLLPSVKDTESITWVVRKIFDSLQEPMYIGEDNISVQCNIGICVYPADGADARNLIKHASVARYYAEQKNGDNNVEYFSEQINHLAREQLHMERQLFEAIDKAQFEMLYQPKISIGNGEIVGFESLIRWNHPRWGTMTPNEFIDVAERTRLINVIGDWVMRESCAALSEFEKVSCRKLSLAVNMSPVQFSQHDLVPRILAIVEEAGIDPRSLELELTENCLMDDIGSTREALARLQAKGVGISIDDFGTGYSGLSYLRTLPISVLKVDRCFVADLGVNEHDTAIVAAIISMAHALGLKVIAEGVETGRQLEALRELSCNEAQGYYFSKPLTVDAARALLLNPQKLRAAG